MATTIQTTLPAGYIATSRFPDIVIASDAKRVRLSVKFGGDEIYATQLATFNGVAEACDLREIIEQHMAKYCLSSGVVTIEASGAKKTATANVVYCTALLPESANITTGFLTTRKVGVLASPSSVISLGIGPEATGKITATGLGRTEDGMLGTQTVEVADADEALWMTAADITKKMDKLTAVRKLTLTCGDVDVTYFIYPQAVYLSFTFTNVFGVTEWVDIPCIYKRNYDASRNLVVAGGKWVEYDAQEERTYEITTRAVPCQDVEHLAQLAASREVWLMASTGPARVYFTDQTIEEIINGDSLAEIKLKFKFAELRPVLLADDVAALMPPTDGVFSAPYSKQYS